MSDLYIEHYDGEVYVRKKYASHLRTHVKDMKLTDDEFRILMILQHPRYRICDPDRQYSIDQRKEI